MSIVPSPPQMGETDKWACAVCGHDEKEHYWSALSSDAGCHHKVPQFATREVLIDCPCSGFEDLE